MSSAYEDLPDVESLARDLVAAREGSAEALGRLLELCRPYLLLAANQDLEPALRGKIGASDLVQETFLEAQRDFAHFHGTTETDLLAWLRRILRNNLANITRQYLLTEKRQASREVSLEGPGAPDEHLLADPSRTPSSAAAAHERDLKLARALEQLTEEQRQVIQWRNYERLTFQEIGERLGRSAEAARKVWTRAIDQLQPLLDALDDTP